MPRYKYAPLWSFFRAQPPEATSVTLTLAELEAIVGGPLPAGAYTHRSVFWSNAAGRGQTWPWRAAGWWVTRPQAQPGGVRQWTVTFTRTP
jgi:hypothetical protein